jgi:hypothetical protein
VQAAPVARGWRAYLTDDEDEFAEALVYCPELAEREFGNSLGLDAGRRCPPPGEVQHTEDAEDGADDRALERIEVLTSVDDGAEESEEEDVTRMSATGRASAAVPVDSARRVVAGARQGEPGGSFSS